MNLSGLPYIAMAGIVSVGVLAMLHVMASHVRNQTALLDFKATVSGLKVEKARRLREIADARGGSAGSPPESPPMPARPAM